jgi:hypothetical protein
MSKVSSCDRSIAFNQSLHMLRDNMMETFMFLHSTCLTVTCTTEEHYWITFMCAVSN